MNQPIGPTAPAGLTKREYFAAIALQSLIINGEHRLHTRNVYKVDESCFAAAVYLADELIKRLNQEGDKADELIKRFDLKGDVNELIEEREDDLDIPSEITDPPMYPSYAPDPFDGEFPDNNAYWK